MKRLLGWLSGKAKRQARREASAQDRAVCAEIVDEGIRREGQTVTPAQRAALVRALEAEVAEARTLVKAWRACGSPPDESAPFGLTRQWTPMSDVAALVADTDMRIARLQQRDGASARPR